MFFFSNSENSFCDDDGDFDAVINVDDDSDVDVSFRSPPSSPSAPDDEDAIPSSAAAVAAAAAAAAAAMRRGRGRADEYNVSPKRGIFFGFAIEFIRHCEVHTVRLNRAFV